MVNEVPEEAKRFFAEKKLRVAYLFPTRTGLEKSIFDATRSIVDFLRDENLHDFAAQRQGPKFKVKQSTKMLFKDEVIDTTTSLYRPDTKQGDPRLWPRGIGKYVEAGEVLALFKCGKSIGIVNCSNVDLNIVSETLRQEVVKSDGSRYDMLNGSIGAVITAGEFAYQDLYLDFEDDLRSRIALEAGCSSTDLEYEILSATREKLDLTAKNPFRELTAELNLWVKQGRRQVPPTLLFLCSLTLAAEKMSGDSGLSKNNYYGRLSELLNLEGEETRLTENKFFKVSEKYWEEFNTWLRINDGRYGFPTAHPIIKNWRYVSYGISQALVRDGDKEKLRQTLEQSRILRLPLAKDPDHIFEVLEPVLSNKNMTSAYLHRLWKNDELKPKIIEAALKELPHVSFRDKSGKLGQQLRLKVSEKKFPYPALKLVIGLMAFEGEARDHEIRAGDSSIFQDPVTLTSTSADFSVLGPPDAFSIEEALSRGFSVEDNEDQGQGFSFVPRQIYALQKSMTNEFIQRDRPDLYVETIILARKTNENKSRLRAFLETCASPNFSIIEEKPGMPEGFFLVTSVFFVKPVSRAEYTDRKHDPLYWICPKAPYQGITINGGIRLFQNIFHASSQLNIIFSTSSQRETVNVSADGVEKKLDLESKDETITFPLETVGREVLIEVSSADIRSKNISLRTSSDVDPEAVSACVYDLSQPSIGVLSASSLKGTSENEVSGMVLGNLNEVLARSDLSHHRLIANVASVDRQVREVAYRENPKNQCAESCVDRKHHYWKVEQGGRHGYCRDCGEFRSWPSPSSSLTRSVAAAVSRPKVKLDFDGGQGHGNSIPDIYDAICYMQEVDWIKFKEFSQAVDYDGFFPTKLAKALFSLGHVDLSLDSKTLRTAKVHCAPAAFYEVKNNFVFSGFRNAKLLDEISNVLGQPVQMFEDPEDPFRSIAIPKNLIFENYDGFVAIRDDFDRALKVEENFASRLLSALPNLASVYEDLPETEFSTRQLERFNPEAGTWESVSSAFTPGAYRQTWPFNLYFLRFKDNKVKAADPYLAKIYAADLQKILLHSHDEENSHMLYSLGNDLPGLFHRAMVSNSALLPKQFQHKEQIIAEGVSKNFYDEIISKLYGQI